ncbi:MAG TPA: serine/threonine-protein kinase [Gemmataceae bacterium]|nr:serine/threonine-protein kinase [Gemmataceae bacterium]
MAHFFLGKYETLGVLGHGSMGQVHAARPADDPASTVVVKVMRPDMADTPRARQFFDREVRYTARLRHPYIVRVLDAGVDETAGPCIVMEFVPGTTLEQLLQKERKVALSRAGWLAGCLCHALEAAHTAAVIHRDLKPANLMVVNAGTPKEFVKVMDFGLAYLASKPYLTKEQLDGEQGVVRTQGTPAYISPEQLRGDEVDGRADLYSAGVVLFEALTGKHPFPYADVDRVITAHLHQLPPRFSEVGVKDLPGAVEAVVQRCLCKHVPDRPSCARELAVELGRALGGDLWKATTPSGPVEGQADIPVAEEIAPEISNDPNALVRQTEAWMPDRIAVIKVGGFLTDAGGEVINTQPGLLQARFGPPRQAAQAGLLGRLFGAPKSAGDGIALDLNLEKPNPAESRLVVTAVFRVPGGGPPRDRGGWTARCEGIFLEMKKYLMAGG